jgi:hypothetical protein
VYVMKGISGMKMKKNVNHVLKTAKLVMEEDI